MSRAVRRLAVHYDPQMKILRIIARLNVGGPARHVVWLTDELAKYGDDTLLIAGSVPDGEEDMSYFADQHGVRPYYISEMSRELSLRDAICIYKVLCEIRRFRPDVIHTHTAKAGAVGRAAALISRGVDLITFQSGRRPAVVHTFHGHVFHGYYGRLKSWLFVVIERLLARLATDAIIVISDSQFREIHGQYAIGRKDQFRIVPLGIDLDSFICEPATRGAARSELGIADEEIAIAFFGRLTAIKNLPMFLQAAQYFIKSSDAPQAKFFIVGDGSERGRLEEMCEDLGIAESVDFLGAREDVARLFSAFDIIGLTSLNEGTPLSILEAMAAGRPVISTLVGGVSDLLGDEVETIGNLSVRQRGVGVPSRDARAFAKGLLYLANDEKLRQKLAKNASEFVTLKYGKHRLVDDIRKLYSELA